MVRQRRKGRIRLVAGVLSAALLVGLMCFGDIYLKDLIGSKGALPLKTVHIDGALTYLTRRHLADMVGAAAAGENLAALDTNELQRALLSGEPWLAQAVLRKKMPDSLIVSVVEHVPAALWNGKGFFDARTREVFYPDVSAVKQSLVRLSGVRDSQAPDVYDSAVRFIRALQGSPLQLYALDVDQVHCFTLTLTCGTKLVLGRGAKVPLERLQRFLRSYKKAGLNLDEIEYVDLRYRDGYAVRRYAHAQREQGSDGD